MPCAVHHINDVMKCTLQHGPCMPAVQLSIASSSPAHEGATKGLKSIETIGQVSN